MKRAGWSLGTKVLLLALKSLVYASCFNVDLYSTLQGGAKFSESQHHSIKTVDMDRNVADSVVAQ